MAGFGEQKSEKSKKVGSTQAFRVNTILINAIKFHAKGKLELAEKGYREAMSVGCTDCRLFSNLGVICQNSGRPKEAISLYKRAIHINPSDSGAYANLGSIYKDLGKLDEALAFTLKSLKIKADNPSAHLNLGIICKGLGKFDQALASTLRCLEIDPNNSSAYMNLGVIYKEIGNLDQALAFTRKSAELNPHNPNAYMNLGSIYQGLGKLDQALALTHKSLDASPGNPDACMNLGSIYHDLGDLDQALAFTRKSLDASPGNPDVYMNLGSIYHDLGDLDQALALTLKSLEIKPNNCSALMSLGMIYETLNELDGALQSYVASANLIDQQRDENCLTSLINASIILFQMNKLDYSRTALFRALKIEEGKTKYLKPASAKNKKTNSAFLSLLGSLIPQVPLIDSPTAYSILHLGESHCLSFAFQKIRVNGKEMGIKPSLVKGAKAFHLGAKDKINRYKIAFERRLRHDLDLYEYIFLSFGEIDCREDEGIISHCQKTNREIEEVAQETATRYLIGSSELLSRFKKKLVYFGTPAPFRLEVGVDEATRINELRLRSIKEFNATLKRQCHELGFFFADVYELTASSSGYNNDKWMIDSRHLKPKALSELVKVL